ncbi:MAG TPA: type II CAAX endopeptidase family protein [Gemmatimonadaceae bacterium]|nr:type II CAAX endopeptidase family protein [Gemmatimonadaceae bacterium]
MGVLGLGFAQSLVSQWIPVGARQASFMIVMAGGLLIGHAWTFHLVDPRAWEFVGLGRSAWLPSRVATCALLGALAIAIPSTALLAMGWLRLVAEPAGSSLGAALAALVVLVPASLWEELFVRGYAFSVLRERWGPRVAIVLTAVLFSLMHFLNAGASAQAVSVVLMAGLFLGLIRETTRSLYAAWAAHLAWNVVLVGILHATVSGVTLAAPDYRLVDAGPDWATGGTWGPEGGYFALAGLVAMTWYVYWRSTRRPEPDE